MENPDYSCITKDTHIVITHSPPILPKTSGLRENRDLIKEMVKSGTKLSVSGHCHWAHGVYHRCVKKKWKTEKETEERHFGFSHCQQTKHKNLKLKKKEKRKGNNMFGFLHIKPSFICPLTRRIFNTNPSDSSPEFWRKS